MTTEHDKEDAQWLQALAGQPDPAADTVTNQQAAALRRALQARKAALDATVPQADDVQYQQLQFRLRREGLAKSRSLWQTPALWGMVATVALVVGVVVQMGGLHPDDDANTMRGGGQATVLIVPNPEVRLAELLEGLKAADASPTVKREPDGRIELTFKSSDKVLDYLASQRIEATVTNGSIALVLTTLSQRED